LTTINKVNPRFVQNPGLEIKYIAWRAVLIWSIIAGFVPLIIWLVKRFPLEDLSYRNIVLHVLFSIMFVPVHALIYRAVMVAIYGDVVWSWESFVESIPVIIVWVGYIAPLSYWVIIGAYYLRRYYKQYQERQLRNAKMEAELASIRLHILKVQLHPHFLFNTLHNIHHLIYEDPETAKNVLDLLKRFLQMSINRVSRHQVPLKEELEFTGTYLNIEKVRFNNRLTIKKYIEEVTLDAQVPSFLLQPLVENAVKHGVSKKIEQGIVEITSQRRNGHLILTVEDNGPGLTAGTINTNGVGIENIRQRLTQLYAESNFELLSSPLGGLKVAIQIPFELNEK
jgi:sensor histidine kinase YesM